MTKLLNLFLSGWLNRRMLAEEGDDLERGAVVGPLEMNPGWAVAQVVEIESVEVPPLADCRTKVLNEMKKRRSRKVFAESMARLEEASEIEILPGAQEVVEEHLHAWAESGEGSEGEEENVEPEL